MTRSSQDDNTGEHTHDRGGPSQQGSGGEEQEQEEQQEQQEESTPGMTLSLSPLSIAYRTITVLYDR